MAVGSTSSTGTGINVPEIVSGLMEVERQPVTKLQTQIDQKTLVISTLGVFKSKVSALESAAKAIQTAGVFSIKSTTSSDATRVSATASNAATAGAYTVKVAQTAQSETSMIGGFASASQVVDLTSFSLTAKQGTAAPVTYSPAYAKVGSLTFASGDKISLTLKGGVEQSFTVSSQTTPAAVASAINAAVTAGTLSDVSAGVDASGYLQISSSNPLRGLAASLQVPGYANFSSAATFNSGDVIRFTTSGSSEQTFVVTTQNTAAKMATAINDAVSAGSLSGVTASVVGGALRITSKNSTGSVTATQNGSGAGIISTAASGESVMNYVSGSATTKDSGITGGKVLITTSTIAAGDIVRYTIEDGSEQTFTVTAAETTVAQLATAIATASGGTITAADVGGKLELTSVDNTKNISGSYGDRIAGIATVSTGLSTTATINNVAAWINDLDADLEATIIQKADGKFALNVSSKEPGAANAFSISGIGTSDFQKDKVTLSGTFSVDDVVVLTVNGEPLMYKVEAADLTADGTGGGGTVSGSSATAYKNIASKVAAAYNLSSSSNHSSLTASADAGVVTLTADAAGTAFSATSQVLKRAASAWTATANSISPAVAQIDKVQLSGTYGVGDVISFTVNGVALSHTVTANNLTLNGDGTGGVVSGSSATAYQNIATALAAAHNSSVNAAHTAITASASGAIITLTADVPGTAFTTATSITPLGPLAIRAASVANSTAPATAQVDTIALNGKYSAGDILKVTVGGIALDYTITAADVIGGGSASADHERIAQSFVAAYNASTNSAHTPVTASYSGGIISLTADTAGTAFVAASSVTTLPVASGTATRAAVVANVSDRGLTAIGSATKSPSATQAASVANAVGPPAVAQIDTVTLSGAYIAGDSLSVSVGGVALTYTVSSADIVPGNLPGTYAKIAQAFVTAYNASTDIAHTPVTASSSGGVITLTANTPGTAFTATASSTGTGVVPDGTYTATFDGSTWIAQAPSGTYTVGLSSGNLTLSGSSGAFLVAGVTGNPKAGDQVSIVVSGGGSSVAATLAEHAAIELQSSRDAFFSINGSVVQRASNQVDDVISGVTFNLNAPVVPASGAIGSIASADFSAAASTVINVNTGAEDLSSAAVEDFVTAYNELLTFYKTESISSQDPEARGVLNGDSTLRTFMERVRGLYTRGIRLADGNTMSFSSIGVEVQRDGTLYLDKGKLNTAVANGLQEKFAAGVTVGYESSTSSLTSFITASLRTTGMISAHVTDAEEEQTRLEGRVSDWEDKLTRIQNRYYRQYAALDALLFRLQTTSNALTSAIESLVNSQQNG